MTRDKCQAASGWAPTAQLRHGGTETEGGGCNSWSTGGAFTDIIKTDKKKRRCMLDSGKTAPGTTVV